MKGHREDNEKESDAALREALEEGGWSTTRDFTKPGDYIITRLHGNSGKIIRGLGTVDDIELHRHEGTRHKGASAMIVVVHDPERDTLGDPGDPAYNRGW